MTIGGLGSQYQAAGVNVCLVSAKGHAGTAALRKKKVQLRTLNPEIMLSNAHLVDFQIYPLILQRPDFCGLQCLSAGGLLVEEILHSQGTLNPHPQT